jgi:DNA gyrase subunit B
MSDQVKNNIKSLDFPESVRTRSVMYMGDSNNANHALTEVVDNAADHIFRDKTVSKIWIKTCSKKKKGDYFVVANDGSPFPILLDKERNKTKSDLSATHMHTGANFEGDSHSIGQNGVGLKGANALSTFFYIITKLSNDSHLDSCPEVKAKGENGSYYYIRYEKGIKTHESADKLSAITKIDGIKLPKGYTTYLVAAPDPIIYTTDTSATVDVSRISDSIITFKNFYKRNIKYILDDTEIDGKEAGYQFKALASMDIPGLKYKSTKLENGKKVPDKTSAIVADTNNLVNLKILLDFEFSTDIEAADTLGNINTRKVSRGIHINQGKELIGLCLKDIFNIPHSYLTKGISINALVLAPGSHLQLAGQTKDSLIRIKNFKGKIYDKSGNIIDNDWTKLKYQISKVIKANYDKIAPHVARLNDYAISLNKLASKDYVKSILQISKNSTRPLISKHVRDASHSDRSQCDLFIVEGKSAASSLLEARNPAYHAIFAMRGYSLNSVGIPLKRVFQNVEYRELISAIGAGVDVHNDLSCARYRRIIIAADADPDGLAITALILSMFGEHLRFLIEDGRVFVNESPLYYQSGTYYRSYEKQKLNLKKDYVRFKGLGELNSDQAEDVFFGAHQNLIRITTEGIDRALEMMVNPDLKKVLMSKHNIIDYGTQTNK